MVLYIIVRIGVYMLALFLTFLFVPGIHIDISTDNFGRGNGQCLPDRARPVRNGAPLDLPAHLFWPRARLLVLELDILACNSVLYRPHRALVFWPAADQRQRLAVLLRCHQGTQPGIWADPPVNVWCAVGGISMAFWLVVLEGITGLDSPLKTRSHRGAGTGVFCAGSHSVDATISPKICASPSR